MNTNELIHCMETLIDLWKSEHAESLKHGWTHTAIIAAENAIIEAWKVEEKKPDSKITQELYDLIPKIIRTMSTLVNLWKNDHEEDLKQGRTHAAITTAEDIIAAATILGALHERGCDDCPGCNTPENPLSLCPGEPDCAITRTLRTIDGKEKEKEKEPDEPDCNVLIHALRALVESPVVAGLSASIRDDSRKRHGIPPPTFKVSDEMEITPESNPFEYAKATLDLYAPKVRTVVWGLDIAPGTNRSHEVKVKSAQPKGQI